MEERIGCPDTWDEHGRRICCKGLEILEGSYRVEGRRSCVIWQPEDDSRQGHIGITLLKVECANSYGVRNLLTLMSPLINGKIHLRWVHMWRHWVQRKYGTTLWEDFDLDEKLECVGLN